MILDLLRRLFRPAVRRVQLARGVRPAFISVNLRMRDGGAHMSAAGLCQWWASDEDVRAELARAWGAARRAFRRHHPGHDVQLGGAVKLTHEWEWRP